MNNQEELIEKHFKNIETMKVLVINGSPHLNGCTDRALREAESILTGKGIELQRVNVGNKAR